MSDTPIFCNVCGAPMFQEEVRTKKAHSPNEEEEFETLWFCENDACEKSLINSAPEKPLGNAGEKSTTVIGKGSGGNGGEGRPTDRFHAEKKPLLPETKKEVILEPFTPSLPSDAYLDKGRTQRMLQLAQIYHDAGCFTGDCKNIYQVFIKIQFGHELGISAMQSMNDLAIIHGHCAPWGAGLAKRFRKFGYKISFKDEVSNFDYVTSRGKTREEYQKNKKNRYSPHTEYKDIGGQKVAIEQPAMTQKSDDKVTVVVTKIDDPDEEYEYEVVLAEVEALESTGLEISRKDKLRWHGLSRIARFYLPEVLGPFGYIAEEIKPSMEPKPDKVDQALDKKTTIRQKKIKNPVL